MFRKFSIGIILVSCLCMTFPPQDIGPAAVADLTFETTHYATRVTPVANTVNDGTACFYDHQLPGTPTLKSQFITYRAGMGPSAVIASPIKLGVYNPYVVAWHPVTKTYLVIYRVDNNLFGRQLNYWGVPTAPARLITAYTADYIALTWTTKKRFALFLERGGQVSCQILRKNGKKVKTEFKLTNFKNGETFPADASTEEDGTAVCYYGFFRSDVNTVQFGALKTDHLRTLIDSFTLGSSHPSTSILFARYFYGAYDPGSQRHACVWRVAPAHSQYMVVNQNGTVVRAATDTVTDATPRGFEYDPVNERFSVFYYKLSYFSGKDHSEFYISTFAPNGTIITPEYLLKQTEAENDASGFCYTNGGNMVVMWVNDILPLGVYGRMFY